MSWARKSHTFGLTKKNKKNKKKLSKTLDNFFLLCYNKGTKETESAREMSEQELLAKAREKLSSLQMAEIYDLMEEHGEVIGVAYRYQKVAVEFESGRTFTFPMW